MKSICSFCGNKNFRKTCVQYIYRHDGKFLVVNNVPCDECEFCGEQYFQADSLKKIEQEFKAIYKHGKKALKELTVPIEEFVSI